MSRLFTASGSRRWKGKAPKRKFYLWSPLPFCRAPHRSSLVVTRRETLLLFRKSEEILSLADCSFLELHVDQLFYIYHLQFRVLRLKLSEHPELTLKLKAYEWRGKDRVSEVKAKSLTGLMAERQCIQRWEASASCQRHEWPPIVQVNRTMQSINCCA